MGLWKERGEDKRIEDTGESCHEGCYQSVGRHDPGPRTWLADDPTKNHCMLLNHCYLVR